MILIRNIHICYTTVFKGVVNLVNSVNRELLDLQQYFNNDFAYGLGWTAYTTMLIDDHRTILILGIEVF